MPVKKETHKTVLTGDTKFLGVKLTDWPLPEVDSDSKRSQSSRKRSNKSQTTPTEFKSAKQLYDRLKRSKFFDRDRLLWYHEVDDKGILDDLFLYAHDQLAGVFIEYFIGNKNFAEDMFSRIKETNFWDAKTMMWNAILSSSGALLDRSKLIHDQLIGIFTEYFVGDKSLAKDMYHYLVKHRISELRDYPLLDCFVSYFVYDINFSHSKENYLQIRNKFWDSKRLIWYPTSNDQNNIFRTHDQLLGVLLEFILSDKVLAKSVYAHLKTYLWNKKKHLWFMGSDHSLNPVRRYFIFTQFLGILVEAVVNEGLVLK